MVRIARADKVEQTVRRRGSVMGYATMSDYDEASDRLQIWFPDITKEEIASRQALAERTLARRNAQPPLGMTTAELIREARAEMDGNGE